MSRSVFCCSSGRSHFSSASCSRILDNLPRAEQTNRIQDSVSPRVSALARVVPRYVLSVGPSRSLSKLRKVGPSGRRPLRPTNHLPWPRGCELSTVDHRRSIHEHIRDSLGIVVRILECADIADLRGVENSDIGDAAYSEAAVILQA